MTPTTLAPAPPVVRALPGLALTTALAALAFALHRLPGLGAISPLILSILLGMALHNLIGTPAVAKDGVKFALRRVLRAGIVLLGLQLTLSQVAEVGVTGVAVIATGVAGSFLFTVRAGRALGVGAGLTRLIAAGTAICGASAVIAANEVTRAPDEDVAYAVACVTIFGSLAMICYPALAALLPLSARGYGLWTGSSVHEVAQAVAAGYQRGTAAGDFATIAKLTRVAMLAPVVLILARLARRDGPAVARPPVPWFVFGFLAMIGLASSGLVPDTVTGHSPVITQALLAVAMAAMGLETDVAKLRARGLRPLALAALAWLFIAAATLALVFASGQA